MSENPFKISVIVPVYNVEKYLSHCIESILSQTFTDFELLLVDDGSTDKSGEICDEYAKTDARIKVFHTENRGVSAARNLGIKEASADWISFVDSDDWVEDKYLSDLYGEGFSHDECIVCQSVFMENESSPEKNKILFSYSDKILQTPFDGEQIIKCKLLEDFVVYAKIFNKDVIQSHGICFCENISLSEDVIFFRSYLQYVEEIRLNSSVLYHYVRRNIVTLTNKSRSSEELLRISDNLMKVNTSLLDRFDMLDDKYARKIGSLGISQLILALINANDDNYYAVFSYVRSKKNLFHKYFLLFNIKRRIFKSVFFIKWIPCSWIYLSMKLYKRVFKIIVK